MRISSQTFFRNYFSDINSLLSQQVNLNHQLSTGKKVNAPSESPTDATSILNSLRTMSDIEQYGVNLEAAESWLKASESAMTSLSDVLARAKTLAEQMSTGTYSKNEQVGAAYEVMDLLAEAVALANTQVNGQYIFSGNRTNLAAISSTLTVDSTNPITLTSQGHGVSAVAVNVGGGDYRLRLSSTVTGEEGSIKMAADSTLGEGLGLGGGAGYDSFYTEKYASYSPLQGAQIRSDVSHSATDDTSPVSDRIGEYLTWTGPTGVTQTYRTEASVSFAGGTAAGTQITVDGVDYDADGATAAEAANALVEDINSAGQDYYAYTDTAGTTVYIASRSNDSYTVAVGTADANMTLDADTSLAELVAGINDGVAATGMVHIDSALRPDATDTVTLGNLTADWATILPGYDGTQDEVTMATALAGWINTNSNLYTAKVVSEGAGNGATVAIEANEVGSFGNAMLGVTGTGVDSSDWVFGGVDPTTEANTGSLTVTGTSDLRLSTTVDAQVIDVTGNHVTVRLSWYDDDDTYQTEDVTMVEAGANRSVSVAGLGDISIYRDDQTFVEGAAYQFELTHYQGNEEDLEVNFSNNTRMTYNWNGLDILGDKVGVKLYGESAVAMVDNTGQGMVMADGIYRGVGPREIGFEVMEGGALPADSVTVQATWLDENNKQHTEQLTFSTFGQAGEVELPGGDGIKVYLDTRDFQVGDSFHLSVEQNEVHVLDTMNEWAYQLINGTEEEGQTASQKMLDQLNYAMEGLLDGAAGSGVRQERILTRLDVMENRTSSAQTNLSNLQAVDFIEALTSLQITQQAYTASLRTMSYVNTLTLLNEL